MTDEVDEIQHALEELYMPSRWVKRQHSDSAVPHHVEVTSRESERVRKDSSGRLGVKYGEKNGDLVDLFNEEGKSGQMMIYISGGYWQELSGSISSYTVEPLVSAGHVVAVVHYDRAPAVTMDCIMLQIDRAAKWLFDYATEKELKVWMSGHSAGSHLIAMLLSSGWFAGLSYKMRSLVRGVVHLSGVFDLLPVIKTSINRALGMTQSQALKYSPLNMIEEVSRYASHVIHLLVVGEDDSPAFHKQTEEYRQQLVSREMVVLSSVVKGEDHFSLVEKLQDDQYSLTKDILRLLDGVYG